MRPDLQLVDFKRLLINVSGISSRCQASHGCQVATVSSHCLHNENSPLGTSSRLFDPVTCLRRQKTKRGEESVSCRFSVLQVVFCCEFTIVIVLSAVSAPTLKSDPGILLETVAGTTTRGMQSSSYFSLACTICRPPRKAFARVGRRFIKTITELNISTYRSHSHLKASHNNHRMNVILRDVQTDLLHDFLWQRSS